MHRICITHKDRLALELILTVKMCGIIQLESREWLACLSARTRNLHILFIEHRKLKEREKEGLEERRRRSTLICQLRYALLKMCRDTWIARQQLKSRC